MLSDIRTKKIAICYITGQITLKLPVPNGFTIEPEVYISMKNGNETKALLKSNGDNRTVWNYLAVVEQGDYKVTVKLGHVEVYDDVTVRSGQTKTLDFELAESQ